jgi:hypothetical protein
MSSSLNLVGTGVVTQSNIQFVEHYLAAKGGGNLQGRGRTSWATTSGAGTSSGSDNAV